MASSKIGDFTWHELMTLDVEAAKTFYAGLFGWAYQVWDGAGMPYTMFGPSPETPIGGVFVLPDEAKAMGAPPHWLTYIAVEDADDTAAKVTANGGRVLMGPMDIPTVGRLIVIQDPNGAVIGAIRYEDPSRYMEQPGGTGGFCWYELHAKDALSAYPFYQAVFGWNKEDVPMGDMGTYYILKRGDERVAGIATIPPGHDYPSNWLPYVFVNDVDASTAKAASLGATTVLAPMNIPGVGRFSIVQDTQGAVIAVFKNEEKA